MIEVDVPDNVMIHGAVATGAVVSAHIATVPTATPGFGMEIYGCHRLRLILKSLQNL